MSKASEIMLYGFPKAGDIQSEKLAAKPDFEQAFVAAVSDAMPPVSSAEQDSAIGTEITANYRCRFSNVHDARTRNRH